MDKKYGGSKIKGGFKKGPNENRFRDNDPNRPRPNFQQRPKPNNPNQKAPEQSGGNEGAKLPNGPIGDSQSPENNATPKPFKKKFKKKFKPRPPGNAPETPQV
jgi:hypothetical protein